MSHLPTLLRAVLVMVLLATTALACAGPAPTPAPAAAPAPAQESATAESVASEAQPAGRQLLVVAMPSAPTSIDPADHRNRESETVIRNMFDGLVTRDTESGVHMELATAANWLDDQTLEIKLREGVKFHDGSPMTADDVVFTFERVIKENAIEFPEAHTSPRKGLIAPLVSVEKQDDNTVIMHFSGPWPVALQMLVHQQILPKAYLEKVGTEGFLKNPIGAGPFKFVSAKGMDEVVMARFDDYYGGAPDLEPVGPACVEEVVFRVIPEASTRVAALLAGEVDIIQGVPADLADTLAKSEGVQIKTGPGTRPLWMELNVHVAPFDDVKVRQALNYAVDKDLLVEILYGGRAVVLPGVLSPYNNYADPDLKPYPYDKDKAAALLKEAGWGDADNNGTLDKDGKPFAFVIDTQEVTRQIAEAVASQLRDVGIEASVRIWEYSVIQPKLLAGERQAYVGDWGDSAFDPVGHMEAKWHGYVQGQSYGRGNFSTYDNPRVNELIVAGETQADPEARKKVYYEAQKILHEEAPAVFLLLPEVIEAARDRVVGWTPAADGRVNLHDVCVK